MMSNSARKATRRPEVQPAPQPTRVPVALLARTTTVGSASIMRWPAESLDQRQDRLAAVFHSIGDANYAIGRLLIATGSGGVLDVVEPGVNGLLVAPGDDEAMAQRLQRLAGDPVLRAHLAAAGGRHVQTHFAAPDFVAGVAVLHQQCLEGQPGPARFPGHLGLQAEDPVVGTCEGEA
jgi:Glycosyl transferases group 1